MSEKPYKIYLNEEINEKGMKTQDPRNEKSKIERKYLEFPGRW